MRRLLIIEPSPTLRHALRKEIGTDYQLGIDTHYEGGLQQLRETSFDAAILGWPSQTEPAVDELLAALSESPLNELPVLLLAHETDPAKLNWISGRPQAAFLLWDNYREATATLAQLFNQSTPDPEQSIHDEPARVLLVDDSPTARVKFSRLLENTGHYKIFTAACADEALAKTEQHPIDIAIIDYFMPDQNGDQLCRQLLQQHHTSSVLSAILTSTYSDKVIANSLAAGAVECMFKNESKELFLARVAAMSRTVRVNRRIERERQRLEGILSSVGDGVFGVDRDGRITFANPAVYTIMGYKQQHPVIGQYAHQFFNIQHEQNNDAGNSSLNQTLNEGDAQHAVESVFIRRDGTPIQVEETIYPLHINGHQEGAVVAFRDISVRKLLEEELKWQVNHDPLTKLLNRKYLEDSLEQEVKRLHRSHETSALLYIDLDRFKYINDTIGHSAGDQLLLEISGELHSRLRRSDLMARIGGDEFGILLRNVDLETLQVTTSNFHQLLSDYTFNFQGRSYKVNASIGVAPITQENQSAGEVLSNADIACTMAKSKGRNQTHIYSLEQDEKAAMDLELGWSVRLQQALENDHFVLQYQPIVPIDIIDSVSLSDDLSEQWPILQQRLIADNRPLFFEVLLRLKNTNGELIAPGAFLPTAERFNIMPGIDAWVLQNALKLLGQFKNSNINFSINLSGQSLHSDTLVTLLRDCIQKYQIDTRRVLLEITESCAIYDNTIAKNFIEDVMESGCRFALDDFGSGYSSFSYLKNLNVDFIKIDGTFVKDILVDPMDLAIVTSINNIAHSLGKKTIAEYVENPDTLMQLQEIGVDYVQGFYISHPKDVSVFNHTTELSQTC